MGTKVVKHSPRVEGESTIIEVAQGTGINPDYIDPSETYYYALFEDKGDMYKLKSYRNNTGGGKEDTYVIRSCAKELIDELAPKSVRDEDGECICKVEVAPMYQ